MVIPSAPQRRSLVACHMPLMNVQLHSKVFALLLKYFSCSEEYVCFPGTSILCMAVNSQKGCRAASNGGAVLDRQ